MTRNLECDGNYCFPHSVIPHALLVARCILLTLGDPQRAHWHRGIVLNEDGDILKSQHTRQVPHHFFKAVNSLRFRHWHCARSVMWLVTRSATYLIPIVCRVSRYSILKGCVDAGSEFVMLCCYEAI